MPIAPQPIPLGGICLALAVWENGDDRRLFLIVSAGHNDSLLQCRDTNGALLWQKPLPAARQHVTLRVAPTTGVVWIGLPGGLCVYTREGEPFPAPCLSHRDGERLGSFVLCSEGFLAAFFVPRTAAQPPDHARVAYFPFSAEGTAWSTRIAVTPIGHPGIVQRTRENQWAEEQKPSWHPRTWEPDRTDPLLVSSDHVLASFYDDSGLGISYCLDLTSGALLWQTLPAPTGSKAIAGPGEFLIGTQGYGVFSTDRYSGAGARLQHWNTHGHYAVPVEGPVRLVEMENCLPSRTHIATLEPDGSVQRGAHLPGYRTSEPCLTQTGDMIFVREQTDALLRADASGTLHSLTPLFLPERPFFSRTLLTRDGQVLVVANAWERTKPGEGTLIGRGDLWIIPTTLQPASEGIWPYHNANLSNNPVFPFHPR